MTEPAPESSLRDVYQTRYNEVLKLIAANLKEHLDKLLGNEPRIDRIAVRAKGVASFLAKAEKRDGDQPKYENPLYDIQDQVAARITTFYLTDVVRIKGLVNDYFAPIEESRKQPESPSEFDYEGHHTVLLLPEEALRGVDRKRAPESFELQIKTLFQHAWSEANHDLIYKSVVPLTREHRRRAAFTAAQAWGADQIFDELAHKLLWAKDVSH